MLNFLFPGNFNYIKIFSKIFKNKLCLTQYSKKNSNRFETMTTEKNFNLDKKLVLPITFILFSSFFISYFANNFKKFFAPFTYPVYSAKFSNKNFYQKLSHIPVFAVTNSSGQPYLANSTKGEQIGLIFFSHEDALMLLKTMQKTRQVSDARIYIMGLDKAYKMVLSNVTSSGIKNNQGQELKMVFRFYPNQKQIKYAKSISIGINYFEKFRGIPVFIAEGLTIRKGSEDLIPIFLSKEDLEEAWSKLIFNNPDLEPIPTIIVGDLFNIIKKMENNKKEYSNFGFFPPKESIEFVKKENKINPSAKIFGGNFQKI